MTIEMKYVLFAVSVLVLSAAADAQTARVPAHIDDRRTAILAGHRPPAAAPRFDRGPVNPLRKIPRLSLIFEETPEQQRDKAELRAAQHDRRSPLYLRWLSPAQYASRFGLDAVSLGRVREWLEAKNFSIEAQAVSRTWIAFSGTAAQVESAFHTSLHTYEIRGEMHFAPSADPSLPADLRPAVLAIRGLDDFYAVHAKTVHRAQPAFSTGPGVNALSPADLETIYGVAPLRGAGLDGTGQTIAIVGRANVELSDLDAYRAKFGLPSKEPQIVAISDPGVSFNTADQGEASLDLETSAAIAPNAGQIYVYANNVDDAIQYVVDNASAPVLSSSFLNCEPNFSQAHQAAIAQYGAEADVKGISWVNASGDSGAAGCESQGVTGLVATTGLAVNAYAAIPEVTGVGGTEFADVSSGTVYWNAVNGQNSASAIGYIPETAWNDSATAGFLAASGGGMSQLFAKPSWQTGPGVPADGARDVPDIAFSASWLHDPYAGCNAGDCNVVGGGTSAGAPLFAGMVALLNQFLAGAGVEAQPGLGNLNPMLYQLAQSHPEAFHDVTTGNNMVPCASGSPDCVAGSFGYVAETGYDLVTGLGSVDASKLCAAWLMASSPALVPTTTTLGVTASIDKSTQQISITVQAASGSDVPSGMVTLTGGANVLGSVTLAGGSGSVTIFSAQLAAGQSTITARYGGNAEFAPSSASSVVAVDPSSAAKPSLQMAITPNPVYEAPSDYGNAWNFTLILREVNGVAMDLTQIVQFKINGVECVPNPPQNASVNCGSNAIQSYFGTTTLPAFGSISIPFQYAPTPPSAPVAGMVLSAFAAGATASAKVNLPMAAAPSAVTFEIDSPGSSGTPVATVAAAALMPRPGQASLQFLATPSSVLRNPGAASGCQWNQQFLLRELAGTGVTLNHFSAGGQDQSSSIASFWGSARLPANGALAGSFCWGGLSAPTLIPYVVSGTDDNGNTVSASLEAAYLNQPSSPNTLTVSSTNPAFPLSGTLNLNSAAPILLAVTTSSPTQLWSVQVFAPGSSPGWLTVNPPSGAGPGAVYIARPSGLGAGTYNATLMFTSLDAVPQVVQVPVTFSVQ